MLRHDSKKQTCKLGTVESTLKTCIHGLLGACDLKGGSTQTKVEGGRLGRGRVGGWEGGGVEGQSLETRRRLLHGKKIKTLQGGICNLVMGQSKKLTLKTFFWAPHVGT